MQSNNVDWPHCALFSRESEAPKLLRRRNGTASVQETTCARWRLYRLLSSTILPIHFYASIHPSNHLVALCVCSIASKFPLNLKVFEAKQGLVGLGCCRRCGLLSLVLFPWKMVKKHYPQSNCVLPHQPHYFMWSTIFWMVVHVHVAS